MNGLLKNLLEALYCSGLMDQHIQRKVKNKIKLLKYTKQIYNTSPVLQDEEVWQYLKDLQTIYCIVPIDKASSNFSFICKKFYVSKFFDEIGLSGTRSDTYKLVNKLKGKVIDEITLSK